MQADFTTLDRVELDVTGIMDAVAIEYYGYEKVRLTMPRMMFVKGDEAARQWQLKLHRDIVLQMPDDDRRERLLRNPNVDNKETFLVRRENDLLYVQFWDGSVIVSAGAYTRVAV